MGLVWPQLLLVSLTMFIPVLTVFGWIYMSTPLVRVDVEPLELFISGAGPSVNLEPDTDYSGAARGWILDRPE